VKAAEHFHSQDELTQIFAALKDVPHLAIAVSGGGDSMALLRLALQWRGTPEGLIALTVDHRLREASTAEAQQVGQWCKALGVEHHTLPWLHEAIASALQAKARTARYDLLSAWCAQHNVPALITAHTVEDQAETVAMRQRRTSSPRSLAGIWPETEWQGIRILRPLINQTRDNLRDYLASIGQDWMEDPSNSNDVFERVRIRKAKPDTSLAEIATASQAAIIIARQIAQTWLASELTIAATGMMQFAPTAFAGLDPLAQDEVLLRLISLGGGAVPELSRRKSMLAWLNTREIGRRTLGGALFSKRLRNILVAREPARIVASPRGLNATHPILWDQRFHIIGPEGSSVVSMSSFKHLKRLTQIPAHVWAGLPVVSRGQDILAYPDGLTHPDVKIEFIKK
jgi:tRNA(Ile)-lysidine synthase